MKGRVIKSTGSWYTVLTDDMAILECRMKGNIRLKGSRSTNPIAVGDIVAYELEAKTEQGVINAIEERKNYIIRKSINLSKPSPKPACGAVPKRRVSRYHQMSFSAMLNF